VVQPPAGTPDFGEDDFEALPAEWVGTPRSGEDDFEAAPDEGRNTAFFEQCRCGGMTISGPQ
jgi:hypothetical protein